MVRIVLGWCVLALVIAPMFASIAYSHDRACGRLGPLHDRGNPPERQIMVGVVKHAKTVRPTRACS